jgi:DNA-binding MarR family transcriptional regulator
MSARLHVDPALRRGGHALDQERVLAAHRFIQFFDAHIRAPYLRTEAGPSPSASQQVLLALGSRQEFTATKIAQELRIDRGYLSRILNAFQERAIIAGINSKTDGRVLQLRLTAKGRKMVESIQRGRDRRLRTIFGGLSVQDTHAVIAAMRRIELIFGNQEKG